MPATQMALSSSDRGPCIISCGLRESGRVYGGGSAGPVGSWRHGRPVVGTFVGPAPGSGASGGGRLAARPSPLAERTHRVICPPLSGANRSFGARVLPPDALPAAFTVSRGRICCMHEPYPACCRAAGRCQPMVLSHRPSATWRRLFHCERGRSARSISGALSVIGIGVWSCATSCTNARALSRSPTTSPWAGCPAPSCRRCLATALVLIAARRGSERRV